MANFEKVFEDLDVKTADISGSLEQVTGSSVQQDEVTSLLQQMMAEQGLAVGEGMVSAGQNKLANPQAAQQKNEVNEMQSRLDALRNI